MKIIDLLTTQRSNIKTALTSGNQSISYKDLYKKVTEIADIISQVSDNIKNVGIFINNSINYVVAYFAICYLDKIIVPIDPKERGIGLVNNIEYCELSLIISDTKNLLWLKNGFNRFPFSVVVFNIDNFSFEKMGGVKEFSNIYEEVTDAALMLHTSGSLSLPKRVLLTNSNLISCTESIIKSLSLTADDITLVALPMFLASANTSQLLTHFYLGASIVIMDSVFTSKYFFYLVNKHKITNFTGVPYMMLSLLESEKLKIQDISSLRFICFGGAPTPKERIIAIMELFPKINFIHMYGQTEASTRITHLLPADSKTKAGSVGKPIPQVELRVIDSVGRDVGCNEVGEIIIKGPNVMRCYYKRSIETALTLIDGWLYTGDMGKMDEDGFLYIVGRKKNVIIRGGMNIYPEEIEEIILRHKVVKEVCVYGEYSERLGEVPIASIVLRDTEDLVTEDDLKLFCFHNLASNKIPERFEFISKLQKTASGKVVRNTKGGYKNEHKC